MARVVVVGAGIFGVTAAVALRARGAKVTLLDPGPVPHPLAASTDISKVVRLDYGADEATTAIMERALEGFRRWNREWDAPPFHETGVLFVTRAPMAPGGFEHDSFEVLRARGHELVRLDAAAIGARFPAWQSTRYVDGYFNPLGGWAESSAVVTRLAAEAEARGVEILAGVAMDHLAERGARVTGVVTTAGDLVAADVVVVAAGSWTGHLLPPLREHLVSVGQPVFHLSPRDPRLFEGERFPVFGADIGNTGWYGFPITGGVVKIAHHGPGRAMHPESPAREVDAAERAGLAELLEGTFPSLVDAPIVGTRVCMYCDTSDGRFWIAPHPDRPGLVVASGGSGHAFKFAPVLGDIIADAVDGEVDPRFRWRPEVLGTERVEQTRAAGAGLTEA